MTKQCKRLGCTETFIHGYTTPVGEPLCRKCGDVFMRIIEDDDQAGQNTYMRARKYLEMDIQRFMVTRVGEAFTPTLIADEDHVVYSHDVLYRRKVEIVDGEDDEVGSKEYRDWAAEWATKMEKLDRDWESRYTQFHDHPDFALHFRKLLSTCSPELLVQLMKCAEFHAARHRVDECKDCNDSDDGVELEHALRDLGTIWLHAVNHLGLSK